MRKKRRFYRAKVVWYDVTLTSPPLCLNKVSLFHKREVKIEGPKSPFSAKG